MRTQGLKTMLLLIVGLLLTIAGCGSDSTDPVATSAPGRIVVTNNTSQLADRIDHQREEILLQTVGGLKDGLGNIPHTFTLVGELLPPLTQGGVEVRATYVEVIGDLAYVAYNREGAVFAGAVEVIDIANPAYPVVISQALFDDTDLAVLALDQASSLIYLAGARNPDISGHDSPAILERMLLDDGMLTDVTACFDVPSWVANGVAIDGDRLSLSTGNATGAGQPGGLGTLGFTKEDSMEILGWDPFNNSQYVAANDDHIVGLQVGPVPALRIYDRHSSSLDLQNTWPLPAVEPADGKNTLVLKDDLAWVALGAGGVAGIALADGQTVNWLDGPEVGAGNPADYISNGVGIDADYLYIANGAGGLYICPLTAAGGELTVGGQWDFQSSANFVTANEDLVFVASGTGGLKILTKTLDTNPLGLALDFPGDDDSVSMGTPAVLMAPEQITLETWCYLRDAYDWMGLISFMTDDEDIESGYSFQYIDGELRFCLKTVDMAADSYPMNPGSPVELNQWLHIAGTFDGTTIKFFLNGELVSEKAITGAIDWNPTPRRFKLGKFYDWNESHYMNGQLDEVRVWNVARSQAEIQADMNHVLSGHEAHLVGYWNFDNGPDELVPDLTGNGSDGSLYNIYPENWVESGAGLLP